MINLRKINPVLTAIAHSFLLFRCGDGAHIFTDKARIDSDQQSDQNENKGPVPEIPANISASDGVFDDMITVTWDDASGAEKYYLYRSVNESGPYDQIDDIDSPAALNKAEPAVSYEDDTAAGLELGIVYFYNEGFKKYLERRTVMKTQKTMSGLVIGLLTAAFFLYGGVPAGAEDVAFNDSDASVLDINNLNDLFKSSKKSENKAQPVKEKSSYSIEETTNLMSSDEIGNIKLDHDDHVYKCMKISREGKDLNGALDALVAFETDFGDTLDNDEVELFIELSRLDTKLYKAIAEAAEKIGKDRATIQENIMLVKLMKIGKGRAMLDGMELASNVNYDMENNFLSEKHIDLIVKLGEIKDKKRFMMIYDAMIDVGMDGDTRDKGLEFLYKVYNINGDVARKITAYLKENEWESRGQPGDREYEVLRDLMKGDYSLFYKTRGNGSGVFADSKKK